MPHNTSQISGHNFLDRKIYTRKKTRKIINRVNKFNCWESFGQEIKSKFIIVNYTIFRPISQKIDFLCSFFFRANWRRISFYLIFPAPNKQEVTKSMKCP